MADWEEIKRLQADFHRAQLSSTAHKLSERNCIELVQKLINSGLVEVIYTTDGKEYLTPQHLQREIRDELFVHGGRVNLVDLQQIINVNLSHIEHKVAEILKHDKNLILVQGELIDNDYLDRCAEEINETLQESGQVFLAELSKSFGFTSDFLLEIVEDRLGSIIHGQLDQLERGVLFTDAFVARQVAHIRGVFSAITRPTQLSSLVAQYGFQEKLFYSVINELCGSGRLSGAIQGRQDKAVFVPDVYSHSQTTWIDDFFKQNGYIEYDALSRLGITDGKQFLKRRYQKEPVQFLPTCCVGQDIQDHVEAAIDEALATTGWVDIQPLIPSPFTPEDAAQLLHFCLKGAGRSSTQVFCDSIVVGDTFVDSCKAPFEQLMQEKAKRDAAKSPALFASLTRKDLASLGGGGGGGDRKENKREERRKKAAGGSGNKGGGGRGSRETKTQKVRDKKKDKAREEESEDYLSKRTSADEIEFMTTEEVAEVLQKHYPDCLEELVEELAQHLHRPLTRLYQDVVRTVFSSGVGEQKRKSHSEVQEKVNLLWANAKLFDKGIKLFGEDVQLQLSRHLLRTVCADVVNLIVNLLAADHMLAVNDETTLTPESRLKIISKMPEKVKGPLVSLNSSLNGKDVEEFFNQFDVISGPDYCEFMIKKLDKKKERQLTTEHRCALQEQLRQETEPAMSLHLAAVLLFQQHTNCMLHVPGRCVPPIITLLGGHMTSEEHEKLVQYQDLVVKRLTGGSTETEKPAEEPGPENEHEEEKSTSVLLEEKLEQIKQLALRGKNKEREAANGN